MQRLAEDTGRNISNSILLVGKCHKGENLKIKQVCGQVSYPCALQSPGPNIQIYIMLCHIGSKLPHITWEGGGLKFTVLVQRNSWANSSRSQTRCLYSRKLCRVRIWGREPGYLLSMGISTDRQAKKKSCSNTYRFYFKTIPQLNVSYFYLNTDIFFNLG